MTPGLNIQKLVLLMTVAAIVAVVVKHIRLPYTIALVIVGLLLSFFHMLEPVELTEGLVLFIFLPPLLFEAAWNLDVRHLRPSMGIIFLMATLGVTVAIGVIGGLLHWVLGFPPLIALLFGAIMAPTDPVSVVAIMKRMKLDHRLSSLIEGESLCNDGTAVVFFKLILAMVLLAATTGIESPDAYIIGGLAQFILVVGGGVLIGGGVGLFFSVITSKFDDHLLELTFTTIVAYGSFLLAEAVMAPGEIPGLHLSGVIATVTSGLVMGNYGRQHGMSASTKIVVSSFWEYAAFFVNSLIFLLIGLEIGIFQLYDASFQIFVAVVAVLAGRAASVYLLAMLGNIGFRWALPFSWQHVLVWGGLRGALSMALVLSLPRNALDPATREMLILMVFGVVLFSLLAQGLTMPWLLKLLGLGARLPDELKDYHRLKAGMITAREALSRLEGWVEGGKIAPVTATKVRQELEEEVRKIESDLEALHLSNDLLLAEDAAETRSRLLSLRKALVNDLVLQGALSEEIGNELRAGYDEQLEALAGLEVEELRQEEEVSQ